MKKLNTNSIANELVNSSFFPTTTQQNTEEKAVKMPTHQVTDTAPVKPAPRPVASRPLSRPQEDLTPKPVTKATTTAQNVDRRYVRRTFDLYEDQLAYLTRASLEERLAGGEGSMNSMVREAIDAYIDKKRRT